MDALVRGDPEEDILRVQITRAAVEHRDYTGVGVFVAFRVVDGVPRLAASNRTIENTPKLHLSHPSLEFGAGVLLWFKDGRIKTLECYTYAGDWPDDQSAFTLEKGGQGPGACADPPRPSNRSFNTGR